MLYLTGDCHGDWSRFSSKNFPEGKTLTRDDFVIVLGDFGIWHDSESERHWLNWLAEKPFTVLFVDGNHENFDRLEGGEFELVDFHGGKVHKIRENIYHLLRGYVFELCGKKVFAFGGASSHDIEDGVLEPADYPSLVDAYRDYQLRLRRGELVRMNRVTWWERELPTAEEMERGLKSLNECGNEVDMIVSHCCPQSIANFILHGAGASDVLTNYFEEIAKTVKFDAWFFGHYHDNLTLWGKFFLLYEHIVPVDDCVRFCSVRFDKNNASKKGRGDRDA